MAPPSKPTQELVRFARWFLAEWRWDPVSLPADALTVFETVGGTIVTVVLYRHEQNQVELILGLPREGGSYFPAHDHPHVDSVEVYLAGEIFFTRNGERVNTDLEVESRGDGGLAKLAGALLRVPREVPHGASVGAIGGVFLSIQQWLDGHKPSQVGKDWRGPAHVKVSRE